MGVRRRIIGAAWRAFAPFLAAALILVPLGWVIERRALARQAEAVVAGAGLVWQEIAEERVLPVFGAAGALPPARRESPLREAVCREEGLEIGLDDGLRATAVLCLTGAEDARRYLAVGLGWTDAAPVRGWLRRGLGGRIGWLDSLLAPAVQGVLLHEDRWP